MAVLDPSLTASRDGAAIHSAPPAAFWAAIAAAAFFVSFGVLHYGFYRHSPLLDTPIYANYGHKVLDGRVPYRDFAVEYPPGALPAFVLPAAVTPKHDFAAYETAFECFMALCGAALAAAVAVVLVRLGASRRRLIAALAVVGLAPLALGPVVLSRFDLWPAALTAGALALLVSGRIRIAFAVLGFAIAAKIYPAAIAGPALLYVWRRAGRREAALAVASLAGAVAAVCVSFLVLAPHGLVESVAGQARRPLQIESLGSGLLLAAHHLVGVEVAVRTSHGSQNLVGSGTHALAVAFGIAQPLAIVLVWLAFARGRATTARLLCASAASVAAFLAFGKVLSPQFLVWLFPLVPLVAGRRGVAAGALLTIALVLTQLWFPYRYIHLAYGFDPLASWLVLARDLVLVALFLVLVLRMAREGREERGAVAARAHA